jgi:hypothetical protein
MRRIGIDWAGGAVRTAAGAALCVTCFVASTVVAAGRGAVQGGAHSGPAASDGKFPEGELAWRDAGLRGIRGITIGPIESSLHPGKGYGTDVFARSLDTCRGLGANWVSLTPFGRTWDLEPTGVDMTFEAPYRENRRAVTKAIARAHAAGLRVLLVPHLWVEHGAGNGWRGDIDPGNEGAWKTWAKGYSRFLLEWAKVAESAGADMLSVGVELRSWVTTTNAPLFAAILRDVRHAYHGPLTYAANWDDVEDTVILGELDVIGINAFFPLSKKPGATFDDLVAGGRDVARRVGELAKSWHKPVLFTEIGYTTRKDPAYEPWTWPDKMSAVAIDQAAQAEAYTALLAPIIDEPWFIGAFVWRLYADPDDMSQEAEWGFSPRGKLAELVVRDFFSAHWEADGARPIGAALANFRAETIGY